MFVWCKKAVSRHSQHLCRDKMSLDNRSCDGIPINGEAFQTHGCILHSLQYMFPVKIWGQSIKATLEVKQAKAGQSRVDGVRHEKVAYKSYFNECTAMS